MKKKILVKSHSEVGVGLLDSSEEDAVVVVLQHGLWVLTVHCFVVGDFLLEVEPCLRDHVSHNVVARFDAGLFGDVSKVVQQGAQVDPGATRLEDLVNQLDEVQDVVGTVDEEAGDDNLENVTPT